VTVGQLAEKMNMNVIAGANALNKEIKGCYCCDLLSWVMAHAQPGNAWVTVQTHANVVAVAILADISCIIIPEAITVDKDTIARADEHNIPILSSSLSTYAIAGRLHDLSV
jgi:predicted transcriptional regulator